MKEQKKQLEDLRARVLDTWDLLGIDAMKQEMGRLETHMQSPGFWDQQEQAAHVSQLHEELRKEVETWTELKQRIEEFASLCDELDQHPDEELAQEVTKKVAELEQQFHTLEVVLLFDGKHDKKNAIVSVYAGSGGTEAQDWAQMLLRMIVRFSEKKGWEATILDESRGTEAGIKSATIRVDGRYAYGNLKSEHGTHRLVRISPFDAEQMRHTSFANIEVIPEILHSELHIDPSDLRIDTFMSGGKGGQSVNTTYSAVRIVHIPTGISVQCQNERSQLQNKETAMRILESKLQQQKEQEEEAHLRSLRGEHKAAEWGNQIRSYVLHPYKMVKDVRTKQESKDPDAVLDGDLDAFVESYLRWRKEGQKT